jgi:hypothetical protein
MKAVHSISEDAVVVWGCGHAPAMEADLFEHGYERIGETWHRVGRVPYSIVTNLRARLGLKSRPLKKVRRRAAPSTGAASSPQPTGQRQPPER